MFNFLWHKVVMDKKELLHNYLNHPMHTGLNLSVQQDNGTARVSMVVNPNICNLVGTLHGSFYFKLMDDACFFAAISLNHHHFVATANFNIHYFLPVSKGKLSAIAKVINHDKNKYVCDCDIVDEDKHFCGHGSGLFVAPKKTYIYKPIN
tara:strand:+ start:309 stop:758 length:450 start_codon:yes stop_codon:yes gene_type:complete